MSTGDSHDWLVHAEGDLHFAKLGRRDAETLPNLIAFHAQQAIEKSLKAILVEQQMEFPKTHDLEELFLLIKETGLTWPAEIERAKEFTPFAVQSRYPGFDEPITQTELDEAIAMAGHVLDWARQVINK